MPMPTIIAPRSRGWLATIRRHPGGTPKSAVISRFWRKHDRSRAWLREVGCSLSCVSMNKKGTNRLAEIRHGRGGRSSRLDSALLAGELYRQQDGNTLSVWNFRHQRYWFFFDRFCICPTHGQNRLEPELALPGPNRVHRRLHHFLQF